MERTHATQQDEALRRVRNDCPIRDALRTMAHGLKNERPVAEFTPADRLTLAREHADGDHDREHALLMRMPHITWGATRGEYGLILDRASWGA
ncbi:hypothetical protein [Streptomyces sp. NPDC013457]|uniref:hypothetical protein n=1 Tax=Streptomyces sp. NPDC013457 TaxID=3364866 RepID=UPI0036F8E28B